MSIKTINKIEKVNCHSFLYDITVENTNNFFADNILVHNCKMDGMRANSYIKNEQVTFFARSGKLLDLLGNMEEELIYMAAGEDIVYDGELWTADENGNPLPRKISNGICSKALKGTISEAEAALINFTVWDRIPMDNWKAGYVSTPYETRFKFLDDDTYHKPGNKVHIIESVEVENIEEAQEVFQSYLESGQEGIILKGINAPWEDKRSKHQLKFKAEISADLVCTGVKEGSGKYAGMIGALELETSDGLIQCSCGSGLDDEARKKDPSEYIGKIIEVKFNEKIKSKGNKPMSLFLPIFVEVRLDKFIANSSEEI